MTNKPDDSVVIVHGLWLHGAVFELFRRRLRQSGFDARAFSYASMRQGFEHNVRALARCVEALRGQRVHLVGHSLGGLLCLRYAATLADARLVRIVLLGSPVRGSSVARRLAERPWSKRLLGSAWRELTQGIAPLTSSGIEIGVIAGNLGMGLGRVVTSLSGPHDGTVTVSETQITGITDSILLPVTHTGMIFSASVADRVAQFLHSGKFGAGPSI